MCSLFLKLYKGYKTHGKQFREGFADTLHTEGFMPCQDDYDVWMRCNSDTYEYAAVYVDDLYVQ